MSITELNKQIAEIKGIKYSLNNGYLYSRDKLTGKNEVLDYSTPELNRGLELELLDKEWRPSQDEVEYLWEHTYLNTSCIPNKFIRRKISNEDFSIATMLAYVEAKGWIVK